VAKDDRLPVQLYDTYYLKLQCFLHRFFLLVIIFFTKTTKTYVESIHSNHFHLSNFVAEERQPYVEQSQVDKQRYAEESAAYRGAAAQQGSGAGSE